MQFTTAYDIALGVSHVMRSINVQYLQLWTRTLASADVLEHMSYTAYIKTVFPFCLLISNSHAMHYLLI